MKQEKKQTVSVDFETRLQPWQQEVVNTLKKDQVLTVYGCGRRTGKSYATMTHDGTNFHMGVTGTTIFDSPWEEWEDIFVWPWDRQVSSVSGKKIWGKVKARHNKIVYDGSRDDGRLYQYATKKEVFKHKLKGAD